MKDENDWTLRRGVYVKPDTIDKPTVPANAFTVHGFKPDEPAFTIDLHIDGRQIAEDIRSGKIVMHPAVFAHGGEIRKPL